MQKPPESERFLAAFEDPHIFDCGAFNLLKVAQDAILRQVGSKAGRTYFDQPRALIRAYFALKRLRSPRKLNLDRWADKTLLAALPPRFVEREEGPAQLYLDNLAPHLRPCEPLLMYLHGAKKMSVPPDVDKATIDKAFGAEPMDDVQWQFITDLNACYGRISSSGWFSPRALKHIRVGFDEFWRNFRAMDAFIAGLQLKHAMLVPGYYTEYLIAALKKHNVEVIELQHGVITPASHFYCYPKKVAPVADRALFADRIWTFGAFWKSQLLRGIGFNADQIQVLGDYFVRRVQAPAALTELEKFEKCYTERVLVGTQTKRERHFIQLVGALSDRYVTDRPSAGIIVKPHPAENPALYEALARRDNVLITDASLDFLYPRVGAYVSMYSNTLFEAARHKELRIFVLMAEETAAFVRGVAESGVAKILHSDDDPLAEAGGQSDRVAELEFFRPTLNEALLKDLCAD